MPTIARTDSSRQTEQEAADAGAPDDVLFSDDYQVEEIDPDHVDAELLALIAGRHSRQARLSASS